MSLDKLISLLGGKTGIESIISTITETNKDLCKIKLDTITTIVSLMDEDGKVNAKELIKALTSPTVQDSDFVSTNDDL